MKIEMIQQGASEQLISVSIDLSERDALKAMHSSVYDHMKTYCDYKKQQILAQSEYAVMLVSANVNLRDGITDDNFEEHYRKATASIGRDYDPTRLTRVCSYRDSMIAGDQLPSPILMIESGMLVQIDGARRLMARALLKSDKTPVIVVVKRRDIRSLLEPEFIERIDNLHQTKRWFNAYQEIIELNLKGKRSYGGRFPNILDFSLFKGKIVAEFGCSNGMAILEAYYRGATKVVGFEFVQENVDIINLMGARLGIPIEAHRIDFNDPDWLDQVKRILPEWDYSVFLSTYRTLELKDRDGLVRGMWEGSREGMIFEGHQQKIDTDEFYRHVFSTKAALTNYEVTRLPKGVIERPYDAGYRPKYLLTRVKD